MERNQDGDSSNSLAESKSTGDACQVVTIETGLCLVGQMGGDVFGGDLDVGTGALEIRNWKQLYEFFAKNSSLSEEFCSFQLFVFLVLKDALTDVVLFKNL